MRCSAKRGLRTHARRETTALQRKLEAMAQQIGNFGLGAALFALAAMAGQFSWATFFVAGRAWDPAFLTVYLKFVITAITILVSSGDPWAAWLWHAPCVVLWVAKEPTRPCLVNLAQALVAHSQHSS